MPMSTVQALSGCLNTGPTELFTTFHIGRQGAVHKENFYVGIPLTFSSISKIQRKYWKSFLQADIISFSGGAATKWSV